MRKFLIGFATLVISISSVIADEHDTRLEMAQFFMCDVYTEYSNTIQSESESETEALLQVRLDLIAQLQPAKSHISTATDRLKDAQTYINLAEAFLANSRDESLDQQQRDFAMARFQFWITNSDNASTQALDACHDAQTIVNTVSTQLSQ